MGTITARKRRDGSTAYLAQIAVMREGKSRREAKTFDRRPAATAWIVKRERDLERPEAWAQPKGAAKATLGDAIDRYIRESRRAPGKTKAQVLRTLRAHDLAARPCDDIASHDLVALAKELRETRSAATVANYLAHLGTVFAIARPAWGYALDDSAMADAAKVARKLGLKGKSKMRDRRPTLDEMNRLMAHFARVLARRPESVPMPKILAFALYSSRRQEEITRMLWADLDEHHSTIVIRDMKNPDEKEGNDVRVDLPPEALRIIRGMPRRAPEIFPFTTDAISAAMTRACKFLAIEDLHFHDLRHEGISRQFEMGRTIPQAASVSGHRSWGSLKRYAHLRGEGDRWAGWTWLAEIAPS